MQQSIQILVAVFVLVMGASHIAQRRAWVDFSLLLRSKGETGAFVTGFLSLPVGALVVSFHNVWTFPAVLLTLFGWQQVLKSLLYLCAPRVGLRLLNGVSHEKSWRFVVAGVFFVAIGAVLVVSLLRHDGAA
jgi:hypothetical protein